MADQEEILDAARDMYLQYGIRSVTMNDIARQLGISKKTLYTVVDNKEDLVYKVINKYVEKEREFINNTFTDESNAIDDLLQITRFIIEYMGNMNPVVKYDLEKYYPKAWKVFQEYKNEFIYNVIYNNIEKGIQQGLYDRNTDKEVIARIYTQQIELIIDPHIFPPEEFDMRDVIESSQAYHIKGIASRFGIRYLDYKLENLEEETEKAEET